MREVSRIRHGEVPQVDIGRLEALTEDYGAQGAERLIGRKIEDLAIRLSRSDRAWRRGDLVRLCHGARELADVADHIGLEDLARAGQTVSRVAMSGDAVALAATVARLMRIGEASLNSAWQVRDHRL